MCTCTCTIYVHVHTDSRYIKYYMHTLLHLHVYPIIYISYYMLFHVISIIVRVFLLHACIQTIIQIPY